MNTLSASDLADALSARQPPFVLSVLAPGTGPVIRGASTASVYEMAFLDTVGGLVSGKDAAIVLHDSGEAHDRAASTAAGKLEAAGYKNVRVLEGGLAAWTASGGMTDGETPRLPRLEDANGRFVADLSRSVIRWTGRNLANHHEGTLQISAGELLLENGALKSAFFEIDMNSIACADLKDEKLNALLIAHLKDDDFFGVAAHPTARFEVRTAEPLAVEGPDRPNVRVGGELTLKGVVQPLDFDATIALTDSGELAAQAFFVIDRTRWGVLYGSPQFFTRLGGHLVSDEIQLHLKIVAVL